MEMLFLRIFHWVTESHVSAKVPHQLDSPEYLFFISLLFSKLEECGI